MKQVIPAKSFHESVKGWSYDEFIATFSPIYPEYDLAATAKGLGIKPQAPSTAEESRKGRKAKPIEESEHGE
ncbi:hypothetical protein [Chitinophaga sp. YIM B06452]|uniref:hypothetical protein n=1 Tax=Chitinophaga sp. YIM B06452 TaxID=3082158 RepID=UPI0031FF3637